MTGLGLFVVCAGAVGAIGCDSISGLLCPFLCPTTTCPDPNESVSLDSRGVTTLMRRTIGDREARFVNVTPSNGGMFGNGLALYENGQQVSFRFGALTWCVENGNSWVLLGLRWNTTIDDPSDPNTETIVEDTAQVDAGNEWTLNNIRTTIAPNQYPFLTGWHVNLYVDNAFVVTTYRDYNGGPLFTEQIASWRAQAYLDICQGWTR
jgi:hypothetical protein